MVATANVGMTAPTQKTPKSAGFAIETWKKGSSDTMISSARLPKTTFNKKNIRCGYVSVNKDARPCASAITNTMTTNCQKMPTPLHEKPFKRKIPKRIGFFCSAGPYTKSAATNKDSKKNERTYLVRFLSA